MPMQLTPHFSLEEFTVSQDATRAGIDNALPPGMLSQAIATAHFMEGIRAILCAHLGRDVSIFVSSAYRCLALNRREGSSDSSDHIKMMAVDWRCDAFGTPQEIARFLAPLVDQLAIGQLINEYPDRNGWVHTSRRMVDKPINRIITITGHGTTAGV